MIYVRITEWSVRIPLSSTAAHIASATRKGQVNLFSDRKDTIRNPFHGGRNRGKCGNLKKLRPFCGAVPTLIYSTAIAENNVWVQYT